MKQILTLSVAILAMSTAATAQHKPALQLKSNQQPTHMRMMNMLLSRNQGITAERTTGIKQRVIATSSWDQTGPSLADSATFGYTANTRGSVYNYNYMTYYYDYPALNNLLLEYIASAPERLDVKADSISIYADNGSGVTLSQKHKFTYNVSNKITDNINSDYSSSPTYLDRNVHSYDANGRLAVRINLEDASGSGVWDTTSREWFKYNAQGLITVDSVEQYSGVNIWSPVAKIKYTYDAASNPTNILISIDPGAGTLLPFFSYDNTFYANNTVKTSQFGINQSGTGIEPAYVDSFGYANGITAFFNYVKELEYDAGTSTWTPYYMQTRHINSQSLPDTTYASQWNGAQWEPYDKSVYTYNSYNNPVTAKSYSTGTTPDMITTYYYEQYNDQSSVPDVAKTWDIKTFPNPTNGDLNIKWNNATIGTQVTISVVGMNGQLVHSETLRWNQATQQLALGNLQPGVYAVTITDEKGAQMLRQNIVKQ